MLLTVAIVVYESVLLSITNLIPFIIKRFHIPIKVKGFLFCFSRSQQISKRRRYRLISISLIFLEFDNIIIENKQEY